MLKFGTASHLVYFWSHFLIDFHIRATKLKLRTSSAIYTCLDANVRIVCYFLPFIRIQALQTNLFVVEEVLSFDLMGHIWKLVKKRLQKWAKCEAALNFNIVSTCICWQNWLYECGTLTGWEWMLWPDNRYTALSLITTMLFVWTTWKPTMTTLTS